MSGCTCVRADRRVCALLVLGLLSTRVAANTFNFTLVPNDPVHLPDESQPRIVNNAPTPQFGPDSWQNVANSAGNKKVNAYVTPEELFGYSVTINDIASISYYTNAPTGQENWFLNLYTKKDGGPNDGSFYKTRFFNNEYTSYTSDGSWHNNTINTMFRSSGAPQVSQTLANWKSTYGSQGILFFSPQTNSALQGNDAQIDGLVITLTNGDVGNVNFAAAPLPAAAWMGMTLLGGVGGFRGIKGRWKKST